MKCVDPLAKANLENMELITEIHNLKDALSTLRKHSKGLGQRFTKYYDAFFKEQKTVKDLEIRLALYGRCLDKCASRRSKPLYVNWVMHRMHRVSAGLPCNCGWEEKTANKKVK